MATDEPHMIDSSLRRGYGASSRTRARRLLVAAFVLALMAEVPAAHAARAPKKDIQTLIDRACRGGVVDLGGRVIKVAPTLIVNGCRNLVVRNGTIDGSAPAPRERRQFRIIASQDVRLENLIIVGPGRLVNQVDRERQIAVAIEGSARVTLTDSTIRNSGSDAVLINDKANGVSRRSTSISVIDNDIFGTGRQCISGEGVVGLRIAGNRISDCQRSVFDFEAAAGGAEDVLIADNDVDQFTRPPNQTINISNDGTPGNSDPFVVQDNRIYGGRLTVNNRSVQVTPQLSGNTDGLRPSDFPSGPR